MEKSMLLGTVQRQLVNFCCVARRKALVTVKHEGRGNTQFEESRDSKYDAMSMRESVLKI